MNQWQTNQSRKVFRRIWKFYGVPKLRLKRSESVKKSLTEIDEDEPEVFGPALVSGNPYKDLDDVNGIGLAMEI